VLETVVLAAQQRDIDAARSGCGPCWEVRRHGRCGPAVRARRHRAAADAGRLLISIGPAGAGAGCEVWQAEEDEPGRVIRWQSRSAASSTVGTDTTFNW
jgi:hypothetical protein